MKKPLVLSPCGSFESLCAAISAGADEVYFGAPAFNARAYAKGFSEEQLSETFFLCKLHEVKTNIALNTLVTDRELQDAVSVARTLYTMGADAFIVQDLGLAFELKNAMPEATLHASTQCACHNLDGAKELSKYGFSRIVLAREMSAGDIREITEYGIKTGAFETEVFVHGALCVSHSGQCLMSSVIGARSGNRGMCAQPCRMQGDISCTSSSCGKCPEKYPLSLRDLSLCDHVSELCEMGIASLKIEGRMKSPEYVYRVTSIWRELIDGGKNATPEQKKALADIFSRGGFTDGYFTQNFLRDNRQMYGVRSEADKCKTREQDFVVPAVPKAEVALECDFFESENAVLTAKLTLKDNKEICAKAVSAECVQSATGKPMDEQAVSKQLSRLGATPFAAQSIKCNIKGAGFMPASALNAMRRDVVEGLTEGVRSASKKALVTAEKALDAAADFRTKTNGRKKAVFVHSFNRAREISGQEAPCHVILPLHLFFNKNDILSLDGIVFGVRLPRVLSGGETEGVALALEAAKQSGARFVQVSNVGHIDVARKSGLEMWGGIGLNIFNTQSLCEYAKLGFKVLALSPELSAAQMRDICVPCGVEIAVFAGGRLELMVLEACIVKADGKCGAAVLQGAGAVCGYYIDRIGKAFPVVPSPRFVEKSPLPCRNTILNSECADTVSKKGFEKVFTDWLIYEDDPEPPTNRKDKNKQ